MPIQFRKEVTERQQTQWKGKALLLSGWSVWITLGLTVGFMVCLFIFLLFTSYTRRITVSGEIITQPHTINLFAPAQGVVSKLLVDNGATVKEGTPLYQIDVSQVTGSGNVTTTTLAAIEKQRQQIDAIITQLRNNKQAIRLNQQHQLEQYEKAQEGLEGMLNSAQQGLNTMQHSLSVYESSQRKGLINTDQLNGQRYQFYQQQSIYQSLNAQFIQQSLQIINLRSEQATKAAEIDNQISQFMFQRDDLDRQVAEAEAKGSRLVTAPSAGVVSLLSVTPGQMVNNGDSLIQLVPASNHHFFLVVWLPDDSKPYVKSGEVINIRYAAFPFEKYGQFPGRIISISSAPVSARELEGYVSAPRTPTGTVSGSWYKAIVALDKESVGWHGKQLSLSSGMLAQSTLFLEQRPLYQWMLSPYYNLKNSVTGLVNE